MFKAEVTKGFKYDKIDAISMPEARLGLVDPYARPVRIAHAKGTIVEFSTHAECKEFARLAKIHGGAVKCVGLPARA